MMKAKLVVVVFPVVAIMLLATAARAFTANVSVTPQNVLPEESVTISVSTDESGMGLVFVKDPFGGIHSYIGNPVSFPGTSSMKYPEDFLGGSSGMMGEYKVILVAGGSTYIGIFFVKFFVIPESAFGTLLGILAPALAFLGVRNRICKRHNG